jgi:hypothetical protein
VLRHAFFVSLDIFGRASMVRGTLASLLYSQQKSTIFHCAPIELARKNHFVRRQLNLERLRSALIERYFHLTALAEAQWATKLNTSRTFSFDAPPNHCANWAGLVPASKSSNRTCTGATYYLQKGAEGITHIFR